MSLLEAFSSALNDLAGQKLRAALTMLGVLFGVGAVIAMLAIGAGAEAQAMAMIERLGLHNVLIRDSELEGNELREVRRNSLGLSLRDREAIVDAVPGIDSVAAKVTLEPYVIVAQGEAVDGTLYGVEAEHDEVAYLRLDEGRFLDALDVRDHAQVAVIGAAIRRELFGFAPVLGKELKVNDVWLTVIGVLAAEGGEADAFQGVSLGSTARSVYVPLSTALRKFDRSPIRAPVSELIVRRAAGASGTGATTASAIQSLLSQLHGGEEDYELVVPEALLEQSRRTQRLFNIVMGCIAGISLVVGGIGIMNIMLATVLERTREIGVRRAVGARRRDILVQFLVESFTISALGGMAGVVMGVLIARLVAAGAGWQTVVTPLSVILATGVAMAVGVASGLYPALRAADLDPIESLRYE